MGEGDRDTALRRRKARQFAKTELCQYFLKNTCIKGERCHFGHSLAEIREKPDLNCTSMCRTLLQTGKCDDPNCTYAHDKGQLRTTSGFFKTKLCRFADKGRCVHGSACRFAHAIEELSLEGSSRELELDNPEPALLLGSSRNGSVNALMLIGDTGGSPPGPIGGGGGSSTGGDQSDRGDANVMWQIPAQGAWEYPASGHSGGARAETSASVAATEGDGDAGQEEPADGTRSQQRRSSTTDGPGWGRGALQRGAPARGGDERTIGRCTTIMITNVPSSLTQGSLVSLLEDLTVFMPGAFDFFYCPWDPNQDRNLGHAIINFYSESIAAQFARQWQDQFLVHTTRGQRRLRIVPATLQGRAANLRHLSGFRLAHHADPGFRPLVRTAPDQTLRPMAVSEELGQPPGARQQGGVDPPHGQAQSYWQPRPTQDLGLGTLAQACVAGTQAVAMMAASAMLAAVRLAKMTTAMPTNMTMKNIAAIGICALLIATIPE